MNPPLSRPEVPVSLVIPCGGDATELAPVLAAVASGSCWPLEVLVVDAGRQLHDDFRFEQPLAKRVRLLESPGPLFPGAARNLGCQSATMTWLAFLDVNTLPPAHWLEQTYATAQHHPNAELVLGATRYFGHTWKQRLFITATYGERPISTLPGSLVHRNVFRCLGGFLPGIRAGEDTDWLQRVQQFGILQVPAPIPLSYSAVPTSFSSLVYKWFRNYRSCAPVVFHLESQKSVYFLFSNLLLILIAFNWNSLAANWLESSPFYLANITKWITFFLLSGYLVMRGFAMPLMRGSSIKMLLPLKWLFVGILCAILDFAKLLSFTLSRRNHRYLKPSFF